MADVFVSYSSHDRNRVRPLVAALERAGWSVWWDREIGAGAAFDRKIEQAIDAARCIVVVWSTHAIDSEWVRAEAHEALERGVLVPVSFDGVRPPLAFRRMQTIALDGEDAINGASLDPIKRAIATHAPIQDDQPGGNLDRGRDAHKRHEWELAYELLASCDARQGLGPEDLERLSWAAFWTARYAETLALLERAEAGFRKAGNARGTARTALHQARLHAEHRNFAMAEGIFSGAVQLLANEPECAEQGQLACQAAQYLLGLGNPVAARAQAERARDIGRRVGDRDVEAMALLWLGNVEVHEGRVAEGIALQNQATAAATSGELDPYYSGYIYCNVIVGCRNRADWHRAAEWTERADRWSERESVGFFPGVCRVHRAEILRFRGALRDAERNVLEGCEQLTAASPAHSVQAFRELAEIRLRLGDLVGAEAACRQVVQLGLEPQPVLAWLRLASGDAASALASIERALTDPLPWHVQNHANLLPAKVSIALAAGKMDVAAEALTAFEVLAADLGTPVPGAAAAGARGEFDLAQGRSASAIAHLRRSVMAWIEERAPYEAASAQCLLAKAYELEGDVSAATLELETALSSFQRLGAALDAKRTEEHLASLAARRTTRRS